MEEKVYLNFNCTILDAAAVHIGAETYLRPSVHLSTQSHPLDPQERTRPGSDLSAPIHIGKRVWIGGTIVCPGVRIGDNTTIGAGSVATKDVPANVVAAGNPCRVIRQITNDRREER